MASLQESEKLHIAIAGAGIAGLTAAIALLKHPLIEISIYEKATELEEIGASIALGPNGLRTLERLGLHDAISDEVAFRGPSNLPMIYRHWKTNEIVGNDSHETVTEYLHQTARYHRGHLHAALAKHVPSDKIHLRKQIIDVNVDSSKGVTLKFKDGSIARADIVLGADGLHSGVRQSFVPDFDLKWSGWTAFRATFDASLVESIPDLPEDSTHWWGPTTSFFASRLGKNSFTTVGSVFGDPDDPNALYKDVSWDEDASLQAFRDIYKDWNPVVKKLTELTPNVRFYPNYSCSTYLDSWAFGDRVTLIGDAAHAHGGAHATGGSLAIDDAYTLTLALNSVFPITATRRPSIEEISKALKLYESIRKPHAEKLLKLVHTGNNARIQKLRSGRVEPDEELRARAAKGSSTNWLHEHDVVKAFEEALEKSRDYGGEVEEVSARL
ncbi:FAD/NAD(P)-binding domain-containing protein [Cadophora sp. DSE1049]|nr:FAD/NAD(P)-binding domain-containing protein [Cadophora sp. DSE1049]